VEILEEIKKMKVRMGRMLAVLRTGFEARY
jgi:hypothetical protein